MKSATNQNKIETALPWVLMWVLAPAPLYIWAVLDLII